jgi:hypothetical protein
MKKGFVPKKYGDGKEYLQGQFNGQDVMVVLANLTYITRRCGL